MRLGKAPASRDLPLLGIKVALCHFQIDDQYLVWLQSFYCLMQVCPDCDVRTTIGLTLLMQYVGQKFIIPTGRKNICLPCCDKK